MQSFNDNNLSQMRLASHVRSYHGTIGLTMAQADRGLTYLPHGVPIACIIRGGRLQIIVQPTVFRNTLIDCPSSTGRHLSIFMRTIAVSDLKQNRRHRLLYYFEPLRRQPRIRHLQCLFKPYCELLTDTR